MGDRVFGIGGDRGLIARDCRGSVARFQQEVAEIGQRGRIGRPRIEGRVEIRRGVLAPFQGNLRDAAFV